MRFPYILLALLALVAAPASAQIRETPPNVQPPAMVPLDDSLEPQVTIKTQDGDVIEEYRLNGKLYQIKVTPKHGAPYILVDQNGNGSFVSMEASGTPVLSVPMWVIGTF